jgi:cytochrome b561
MTLSITYNEWTLVAAVALHVAAIAFYRIRFGTDLVSPMMSGSMEVPAASCRRSPCSVRRFQRWCCCRCRRVRLLARRGLSQGLIDAATLRTRRDSLHWIVAALILFNLAFGLYLWACRFSPQKLSYFSYHKWIGVTVLLLATARLLWRLSHPAPALPAHAAVGAARRARFARAPLRALLRRAALRVAVQLRDGFQTVYLGVVPIPDLLSKNKEVADVLKIAHHWINYTLAAVIAVHAAAALKHHFIDRDDVLVRMLPPLAKVPMNIRVPILLIALARVARVGAGASQDRPRRRARSASSPSR